MSYTIVTVECADDSDSYTVVVMDKSHKCVAEMGALSLNHARDVADDIVLLLTQQKPGRQIIRQPLELSC